MKRDISCGYPSSQLSLGPGHPLEWHLRATLQRSGLAILIALKQFCLASRHSVPSEHKGEVTAAGETAAIQTAVFILIAVCNSYGIPSGSHT